MIESLELFYDRFLLLRSFLFIFLSLFSFVSLVCALFTLEIVKTPYVRLFRKLSYYSIIICLFLSVFHLLLSFLNFFQGILDNFILVFIIILSFLSLYVEKGNRFSNVITFLVSFFIFLLSTFIPYIFSIKVIFTLKSQVLTIGHILFAIAGGSFYIFAFCLSLIYIVKYKKLKKKSFTTSLSHYNLEKTLKFLNISSLIGFICITISLVTGFLISSFHLSSSFVELAKLVWSLGTWFWYAFVIIIKNFKNMKDYTYARLMFFGVVFIFVTFLLAFIVMQDLYQVH